MQSCRKRAARIDWDAVDTVMLDMDGTLLDKHFDDYFWEVYLPEHYSLLHDMPVAQAAQELKARYRQAENSLQWSDIAHWSRELQMDIPELKLRISHLIAVHPHVPDFLAFCRKMGKRLHLVTNAHPQTLNIKLNKADIGAWFDRLICADQVGFAKEEPQFWIRLQDMLGFAPQRSLFADDTEKVLRAADDFGIAWLIHIAKASSRKTVLYAEQYPSVDDFAELM